MPLFPAKQILCGDPEERQIVFISMTKIGTTTWPEIFATWKSREGANLAWTKVATEVKGWPDWESWRMFTAEQLGLPKRSWSVFSVDDPMTEIPNWLVGPYTGWQSRLPAPNVHTFAEMAAMPEQAKHFSDHSAIKSLRQAFPAETQFIALRRPDGRIILLEGHHRAMAIALAAKDDQAIHFGQVRAVIADLSDDEQELLDEVLARGSAKEPPSQT